MNDLPLSKQDFERYERSVSLLQDVVAQINKDFRLQGFEVEFSGEGETAYQELSSQLNPVIALRFSGPSSALLWWL